jgi:two-component system, OmpR family, sensor histidine kinase VicK
MDYSSLPYVEEKTEVIYGDENIIDSTLKLFSVARSTLNNCLDSTGPSMDVIPGHPITRAHYEMKERGVKIRYITEITKENVNYCKELMNFSEVRHLDEVKGNFGVLDGIYYRASAKLKASSPPPLLISSTVRAFVEQQEYFFDMLWKKAIPAKERIGEIEQGLVREFIETISDPNEIQKIAFNLIHMTCEEIRMIFPTPFAFHSQGQVGIMNLLNEISLSNPDIKVRVLTGLSNDISFKTEVINLKKERENKAVGKKYHKNLNIREVEQPLQSKVSLLIVDKKYSLAVEIKEDEEDGKQQRIKGKGEGKPYDNNNYDFKPQPIRMGLATYSNSKSTVLSYASIFETLWKQVDLYDQLKQSNNKLELSIEQLKTSDEAQKMFINIAAHELRTPIQPILGLSSVLRSHKGNINQDELLDAIVRNAARLQRLSEDILDVTRIEGKAFKLNKEMINLNDMILTVIKDYRNQIAKDAKKKNNIMNVKILFEYKEGKGKQGKDLCILADSYRLTQVISNLLNNAIKFTKNGTITVGLEKQDNNKHVIVYVKDTGQGIAPEILPKLFTKFTSKSEKGTGLGLFISKSIVESHGGKIWAENNRHSKGATFTINLPLIK